MAEFTVIHNGSTNLPLKRAGPDGQVIPDATLREIHEDCKQILNEQIEHGVLAEEYGFDRVSYTEHHFQLVGAEFSPNPLLTEMAVARETDDIRLVQLANIVNWHDPIRFAEQTAQLDVVSDGRVEVGVGRGYQPREAEVLGDQYWGGTIQDQEKNRVVFEEKLDLIRQAWTEDAVTFSGEYHNVPPSHTKWHHDQERLWLEDEASEYELEDFIDWKEGDLYSQGLWSPVVSGGSTLEAVSVFPQPVQEPHPQLWQPVTSFRSVQWCAQNGVNGISFGDPNVMNNIELYHEEAEKAGWPDHRPDHDGEPFGLGWDDERQRGIAVGKWVFNTDVHDEETFERWKLGLEHGWDYFG
ncbi:MAG: LLM class flavin-dependent oxidoreductase, partial [Haloarculaceae archaeon]